MKFKNKLSKYYFKTTNKQKILYNFEIMLNFIQKKFIYKIYFYKILFITHFSSNTCFLQTFFTIASLKMNLNIVFSFEKRF